MATVLPFITELKTLAHASIGMPKLPIVEQFSVVSMFSGCGGMDLGFHGDFEIFQRHYPRLPFHVIWANELNKAACATYRRNLPHEIQCADIRDVMHTLPKRTDVLIGGFPCQDISVNGKMAGISGRRSGLYRSMVEAVEKTRPKVFVAENVKGLLMKHSVQSLKTVLNDFGALGYHLSCEVYRTADYGVPQTRERVFIVGTAKNVRKFVPPPPERGEATWMTAQEAIANLEEAKECAACSHIWSRAKESPDQGSRRLRADRPAYTIRAECHGNIQYHYRLPRRISMREAARFQSFPDSFKFEAKLRETERQIGNAVPPVMAWHIARAVLECVAG
jgi:DNA (cytosine-5)-methyltransferase 1